MAFAIPDFFVFGDVSRGTAVRPLPPVADNPTNGRFTIVTGNIHLDSMQFCNAARTYPLNADGDCNPSGNFEAPSLPLAFQGQRYQLRKFSWRL